MGSRMRRLELVWRGRRMKRFGRREKGAQEMDRKSGALCVAPNFLVYRLGIGNVLVMNYLLVNYFMSVP